MYDPQVGQFLQEDPIGFEGLDSNLRRYVKNHPTYATDPSGLQETGNPAIDNAPSRIAFVNIYAGHGDKIIKLLEESGGFFDGRLDPINKIGVAACWAKDVAGVVDRVFGKGVALPRGPRGAGLLKFENAPSALLTEFRAAQKYAKDVIKNDKADLVEIRINFDDDFRTLLSTGMLKGIAVPISPEERKLLDLGYNFKRGDGFQNVFNKEEFDDWMNQQHPNQGQ